jgi:hypothetical protein
MIDEEEDVTRGFSRWREATATSPSGWHLGHYHAIIQDDTILCCSTKFLDIVVQPSRAYHVPDGSKQSMS